MNRNAILVLITGLGSMFCWWDLAINPGLEFPWWIGFAPITLIALATGLATTLSKHFWPIFLLGSFVGTLGGIITGGMLIWPSPDAIGNAFLVFFIPILTGVTTLISLGAALIGRRISVTGPHIRQAIWLALFGYCTLGPSILFITPSLVNVQVARNNRIAKQRFEALRSAVVKATAEEVNFTQTCDGNALSKYYFGPSFSRSDLDHIGAKDGVQPKGTADEDGYDYLVACYENGVYTIAARPTLVRPNVEGALSFCADQTGKPKCGFDNSGFERKCAPCAN